MNEAGTAATPLSTVSGPQAWRGADLQRRDDWRGRLDSRECDELLRAVDRVAGIDRPLHELRRDECRLPVLESRLAALRREVLHGRGLFLLQGIPVDRLGDEGAALALWVLGLHLGEAVSQNGAGHLLGHVTNLGLDYADPGVRGYQTDARLPYHTDFSDIVGLLCLRTARSGGRSSVVSSTTLWNELVTRRPDLATVLTRPLHRSRWGEVPAGRQRASRSPVFTPHQGRVICAYVRSAVRKAQAFEETPRLTPEQEEAMDALDALAADPALHLDMDLEPGELQLLCNHCMLHSRTAYDDWPEPAQRRHMLRLWLACDDGPALPAHFTEEDQERTPSGRPNGIRVPGVPLIAPLHAG